MFLFDFFRSFLPLHNPIGFGAADFLELAVAVLLVWLAIAWRAGLERYGRLLAGKAVWSMCALAVLPVVLRLLLLGNCPVPTPAGPDDFSHLLVADTLRHFRLANPTHAMYPFFETFFVLQQPTYSSIFPIGQGLALAIGWLLFGHPWAGVVLSVAALCALCYWMLRAWVSPGWALVGGLLAVAEFGPLTYWMNSYWGGAVSAVAGCLVFGALPRLRDQGRPRDAVLLGLGLGLQLLARPFESILLLLAVVLFLLPGWRPFLRTLPTVVLAVLPAVGLTLLHNRQVTGSWTTLPYSVSRYQYGVPAAFTFEPNPVPHRELTPQQQLHYEVQAAVHGTEAETPGRYLARLGDRMRFYRFFLLAPLYLALPAFFTTLREPRFLRMMAVLLLFALGANFYPYFYPHYLAAVACLFVLASVVSLDRLSRWCVRGQPVGQEAARWILFLCAAHFVFWYALHASGNRDFALAMRRYETWAAVPHGDPDGRIAVARRLQQAPGQQLVFVRYGPRHAFQEWVRNAAEIDAAPVVWARDRGPAENEKLRRYYPHRTAWLLEPDAKPLRLTPYVPPAPEPEKPPVRSEPLPQPKPFPPGVNPFEPVR
jgi:hypothetical protein